MSKRKLVLTGFMGTGKTTLAERLAKRAKLPLIDLDRLIEQKAGLSVNEIFAHYGEVGFRAWEASVCAEVGASDELAVISTGGGALLTMANREAFQSATIVCLNARPEVIWHRVKEQTDRPLLAGGDPQKRIQALLAQRQPLYKGFRWQVDTSDLTIDDLVNEVMSIWAKDNTVRQFEQRVKAPTGSYPLLIGEHLIENLNAILEVYGLDNRRTVIITDSNVVRLYGEALVSRLPNAALAVMPAGESYKHLDSVARLYDTLAQQNLDRHGLVIALGGGVVGDTAGFVAASYMRGVSLVQIPTTLLAMVDSSVGGKVGVDIPMGKNLVGAFKQPDLVVIDPMVLNTLSEEEMRAGMAEVIKHGLLANPGLLDSNLPPLRFIKAAIQVKIDIVERDPYEQGERAYLNLGHTFAHAIERVSDYSWRHGDAVAVGLMGAALLSQKLGYLTEAQVKFIQQTITRCGLPTYYRHYAPQMIYEAMATDKKWVDGRSHFVLLQDISQPIIVRDVPASLVLDVLEALRS